MVTTPAHTTHKVHGADIFTARSGIRNQISCIRDWLLLTDIDRETAYTVAMQMQELADAALRKTAERQTRTPEPTA